MDIDKYPEFVLKEPGVIEYKGRNHNVFQILHPKISPNILDLNFTDDDPIMHIIHKDNKPIVITLAMCAGFNTESDMRKCLGTRVLYLIKFAYNVQNCTF